MSSSAVGGPRAVRPWASAAFWACCFAAPIVLLALMCAWGGVYPFGPESFLTEDAKYQYVDLFTWFRRVLLGEASPFYLADTGLGANAWGLVGYYLSSPFNVLLYLFDEDHLVDFFWLVTALKLGCAQVSAAWYLRRRFGASHALAFALSLCFTWSSWTATQMRNPLWLDALILLPIAAYGVYLLVREARWVPLAITLAVSVAVCWYTAYMAIIFLALLSVVELVAALDGGASLSLRGGAKRVGLFIGAVAVALLLAAFTFLPSVEAQLAGSGGVGLQSLRMTGYADFASGFFVGTWVPEATPQHFAGALVALLVLAFSFAGSVPVRTKVAALAVLAFMLASAFATPLLYVWSGSRMPSGFYCRITFMTVFLAVWMSAFACRRLKGSPGAGKVMTAAAAISAAAVGAAFAAGLFPRGADALVALASIVACAVVATVLVRGASRKAVGIACAVALGACVFVELAYGAHLAWSQLYVGYPQQGHDTYVAQSRDQLAELESVDPGLYRVEKTYTRAGEAALNEGAARGYLALSTYASSQDIAAVRMMNGLGYSKEGPFSTRYATPLLFTDSLLGVKYVSATERPAGFEETGLSPVMTPEGDEARFYRNPYALSLGYCVSPGAAGFELDAGANPFERQNALASALLGRDVELYRPLKTSLAGHEPDRVSYRVEVPEGDIGYAYVSSEVGYEVLLSIDGTDIPENRYWRHALTSLGDAAEGTSEHEVSLVAAPASDYGELAPLDEGSCLFYGLDMAAFSSVVRQLGESPCNFTAFESGHIEGSCTAAQAGFALISIPDARGWSVRVNGEPAETASVCAGGLMLVAVDAGENAIALDFVSPGFVPGAVVSALTALALLAGLFVSRKRVR